MTLIVETDPLKSISLTSSSKVFFSLFSVILISSGLIPKLTISPLFNLLDKLLFLVLKIPKLDYFTVN